MIRRPGNCAPLAPSRYASDCAEIIDFFPQMKTSRKVYIFYIDFYILLIIYCYVKQC